MAHTRTDGELAQQILGGDLDALTELLGRYEQSILRYAISIVRDPDDAEDVVQTAYIRAYQNLRQYDPKRPFRPWLFRIVRNQALNWLRSHRTHVYGEAAQRHLDQLESGEDTHASLEKQELQQQIQRYLFELPLKYREALVLYYLEERSYQEVSDILRIPIGTVGTNISRGKQQLKQLMDKNGDTV